LLVEKKREKIVGKKNFGLITFQPQNKLILMLMGLSWRDEFDKCDFDL